MQFQLANAGRDIDARLPLQRQGLKRHAALRSADQHIGTEARGARRAATRSSLLRRLSPMVRPCVAREPVELAVSGLASMMGWTAPHSHVTRWSDSRQQRGGGHGYQS